MKKFVLILIIICAFVLTACNDKNSNMIEPEATAPIKEIITAEFLSIDKGQEELKNVITIIQGGI